MYEKKIIASVLSKLYRKYNLQRYRADAWPVITKNFSTPLEHGFGDKKGAIVKKHLSQRIIKNAVSSQSEKVPFQV